jgi:transcription antitermination factor NusB
MKPERPLSDLKRKAREIVVKTLYEMEMGGLEVPEARARVQKKCQRSEVRQFALRLFDITLEHFSELDSIIVKVAENWDLNRMAVVDRNVLRLGTAEILFLDDVPDNATINEAIEIAKKFSTENSGRFVNGILDKVARMKSDLRSDI